MSGVSNYTPDGKYLIGSLPGIKGFMAVTGCSGTGIASSAGFGRLVAQFIDDEFPFVDPEPFGLDRFGPVDPHDMAFRESCVRASSAKRSGWCR